MVHDPYVQANLIEAAGPYRSIPDLHAALPETDILTVHLPLGPESRGLIGSEELAPCPRTPSSSTPPAAASSTSPPSMTP